MAIMSLLFQQAALAAYLCPIEQAPSQVTAVAEHCAGMDMTQARTNPGLCDKHCHPDHQLPSDSAKLAVPPLALPAKPFEPVLAQAGHGPRLPVEVAIARSDPPPRLRYCSLLI